MAGENSVARAAGGTLGRAVAWYKIELEQNPRC